MKLGAISVGVRAEPTFLTMGVVLGEVSVCVWENQIREGATFTSLTLKVAADHH